MTIGILKEINGDNRVSALPETVSAFIKLNTQVFVEDGAGNSAFANNKSYEDVGAIIANREDVISKSDIILSINNPNIDVKNKIILGTYQPLFNFLQMKT